MANGVLSKLSRYGRRCRSSCIHIKSGYMVLLLSLLSSPSLFPLALQRLLNLMSEDSDRQLRAVFILLSFSVVLLLFAPLYGLIGEYWMRAKVLLFAAMARMLGSAVFVVIGIIQLLTVSYTFTNYMYVAAMYIFNFGDALYFVNLMQFAADQFQFASSDELRNFVYWFFWIFFLWLLIPPLLLSIGNMYINYQYVFFGMSVCIFVINIAVLLLVWFMKHHLIIEPAQYNNPIKLIWKVMKYICKYHKHPVRRSAFTYGELPPSGLDIAKERYGGPFTTEQVEDVKIFWNIFILFVSMFGYGIQIPISYVTSHSLNNTNSTVTIANETSFVENIILRFPLAISYITALIYIPIYQLIIIPFFYRYAPNMLKRFWIGLVLVLLQLILRTIFYQVTAVWYTFILLEVLYGLSMVYITVTLYEFILAQSPRRMLGLLLGIGFVVFNSPLIILVLITAVIENNEYRIFNDIVKTVLIFISVICYTVAACRYRYRQRNELSDINERIIITQYTERYLDRRSTLQDESSETIHIESLSI